MHPALNARNRPAEAGREFYVRAAWIAAVVGLAAANARAWWIATTAGFAVPLHPGVDFDTYRIAAERWLAGGPFYYPFQLSAPYDVWNGVTDPILYPPTILPLLAAFTVLPAFLWWAVPLGIIAACVAWHRPRPLALALVALLVVWPRGLAMSAWFGNPTMWVVAALAVATTGRSWSAPFVLLKPSLFPFALWGIYRYELGVARLDRPDVATDEATIPSHTITDERPARSDLRSSRDLQIERVPNGRRRGKLNLHVRIVLLRSRGWWFGLGAFVAVSLLFAPLWIEYARVLLNARNAGVLYSLWDVPAMLVPVVAWAGSTSGGPVRG